MIYFVQQGDSGPIKIGYAKDPKKRLSNLQSSNPHELKLLHCGDGGLSRERALHESFNQYRIRGEWFKPSDELVNFIHYLRGRGYGFDCDGEVVERGDIVNFVSNDKMILGRVLTNPIGDNDCVLVSMGSGNSYLTKEVHCDDLKVVDKNPDDEWHKKFDNCIEGNYG